MSGNVLTHPYVGFFGKLPVTGDFVARGLPDSFRKNWDAWVTRHVAPRMRTGRRWPQGGLRCRLISGDRTAGTVIVPSADSAGRIFPLSLFLIGTSLPGQLDLCPWFGGARRCAEMVMARSMDADALQTALEAIPLPEGELTDAPPMLLWTRRHAPETAEPDAPGAVLDRMLEVQA
jgi:type VI secretion system protein ImpM